MRLFQNCSVRLVTFSLFLCNAYTADAQKQYFKQYNIEQGLGQSQVTGICQDKNDNLWISTLGGLSKFDAKSFTNYSETDGLCDNNTNCVFADSRNEIWTGTQNGLSRLSNSKFKNYRFPAGQGSNFIRNIQEDKEGNILVLTASHVYAIRNDQIHLITVDQDSTAIIMSMMIDKAKRLWMAVRHKGIYCRENDHWIQKASFQNTIFETEYFHQLIPDPLSGGLLLLTSNNLFALDEGTIKPASDRLPASANFYMSLFFDRNHEPWLVAGSGIFHFTEGSWRTYHTRDGYTNIPTICVTQDRENSIWLGTSGGGIYQFNQQSYVAYDQFSSADAIVMQLVAGKDGKLYIGTDGSGLYSYQNDTFKHFALPSADKANQQFISMCRSQGGDLMISTKNNRVWKFHNSHFEEVYLKGFRSCINGVHEDDSGKLWICACNGLYTYRNAWLTWINDGNVSKVFFRPDNSIIETFYKGMGFIHPDGKFTYLGDSLLDRAHVLDILFKGKYYVIATSNRGLIIFDTASKKTHSYTTENGLNSNFVYSLAEDRKGQIWLGTGQGLNKLAFDSVTGSALITNEARQGDISSAEFNEGAALSASDGQLWFGTASGLMKFTPGERPRTGYMPPLVFKNTLPAKILRSSAENHILFDYNCASYEYGNQIFYQYYLSGVDPHYSEPSSAQQVIYPQLPPGKYVFNARAVNRQTGDFSNTISYPFEILPMFYQTIFFKIILLIALTGALYSIFRYRSLRKEKRIREIEDIRQSEQIKLRQQAAEDFHDEMGNTITRIQLLADMTRSKLLKGNTDVNMYIDRIKENVSLLYQGTRDIIWALSPNSDHLEEIIFRLTTAGSELFYDTEIIFSVHNNIQNDLETILPGHTGRNILLIFKEAMNNILKHARATNVSLDIEKTGGEISIVLQDDGYGFIAQKIKKGYGTINMAKRAERIDGVFTIESCIDRGTRCQLIIHLPLASHSLIKSKAG